MKRFTLPFLFLFLLPVLVRAAEEKKTPSENLLEAAEEGNLREVREWIKKGADVNFQDKDEGITPLIAATLGGFVEVAQALIQAGADVNGGDEGNNATALMWACTTQLDEGARERGETKPPPVAKKLEVARLLIKSGAKVNQQNAWGGTALQWAADAGNTGMVKLLLANKADPNLADQQGLSPLMAAANYEGAVYLQMMKDLLAAGAKIEAADQMGETALMKATNPYKADNILALIAAGANVNAADNQGYTVLMKSCQRGRADIARVLTKAGARLDARTKDGRSVLKVALDAGYKPTIQVIQEAGAKE